MRDLMQVACACIRRSTSSRALVPRGDITLATTPHTHTPHTADDGAQRAVSSAHARHSAVAQTVGAARERMDGAPGALGHGRPRHTGASGAPLDRRPPPARRHAARWPPLSSSRAARRRAPAPRRRPHTAAPPAVRRVGAGGRRGATEGGRGAPPRTQSARWGQRAMGPARALQKATRGHSGASKGAGKRGAAAPRTPRLGRTRRRRRWRRRLRWATRAGPRAPQATHSQKRARSQPRGQGQPCRCEAERTQGQRWHARQRPTAADAAAALGDARRRQRRRRHHATAAGANTTDAGATTLPLSPLSAAGAVAGRLHELAAGSRRPPRLRTGRRRLRRAVTQSSVTKLRCRAGEIGAAHTHRTTKMGRACAHHRVP
jgi:hypothetical protein